MFIKLLLKILKPTNEQLKSKSGGSATKLKIQFYQSILKRLLKTYTRYTISDSINLNKKNIRIVHEYRDLAFESELVRNKIDFKPNFSNYMIPTERTKSKKVRPFYYFNFKDVLSVYVDGKELFIKHDDVHTIDSTIECKIKLATNDNAISQSVIEVITTNIFNDEKKSSINEQQTQKPTPVLKETGHDCKPKQTVQKTPKNIFGRDKDVILNPAPISNVNKIKTEDNPKNRTIEKKGFEIDTTF